MFVQREIEKRMQCIEKEEKKYTNPNTHKNTIDTTQVYRLIVKRVRTMNEMSQKKRNEISETQENDF